MKEFIAIGRLDVTVDQAKLVFIDLETTGLSPAMGDRIVEIGMIACQPNRRDGHASQLINPERPIPPEARQVHGIDDEDVRESPTFTAVARSLCKNLHGCWLVGHNVRFDVGFLAMEIAMAGHRIEPAGCLDTCQLAAAVWELSNYQLGTVVSELALAPEVQHRALDDAKATKAVFDATVNALGGATTVLISELLALHRYQVLWPEHPQTQMPGPLYDALTSGREIRICYVNGDGKSSSRTIRPCACVPVGRNIYVKAHCSEAGEMRTFRLDRILKVADAAAV